MFGVGLSLMDGKIQEFLKEGRVHGVIICKEEEDEGRKGWGRGDTTTSWYYFTATCHSFISQTPLEFY